MRKAPPFYYYNQFATKVEELWQSLMQEYLTFSKQSVLLRANNSGHYIHLTDFEVIMQALRRNIPELKEHERIDI